LSQYFRKPPGGFQTHLEALGFELTLQTVFEPLQVRLIVAERGLGQFDVGFPHERSQRHFAVREFADLWRLVYVVLEIFRRSDEARMLGYLDRRIRFDATFACEDMSLLDLFVREEIRGPARHSSFAYDDSASSADPIASAEAVDEDTSLSGSGEDRFAKAHLNCLVVGQERDFAIFGH
jgi:hypothetical protein